MFECTHRTDGRCEAIGGNPGASSKQTSTPIHRGMATFFKSVSSQGSGPWKRYQDKGLYSQGVLGVRNLSKLVKFCIEKVWAARNFVGKTKRKIVYESTHRLR